MPAIITYESQTKKIAIKDGKVYDAVKVVFPWFKPPLHMLKYMDQDVSDYIDVQEGEQFVRGTKFQIEWVKKTKGECDFCHRYYVGLYDCILCE